MSESHSEFTIFTTAKFTEIDDHQNVLEEHKMSRCRCRITAQLKMVVQKGDSMFKKIRDMLHAKRQMK